MTGRTLEDRYRRLLRAYPEAFRRRHGEDLITVLLATSADGQHRPRPSDAVNLIRTGLRMRLVRSRPLVAPSPHDLLPGPSSAPLPESYAQALLTMWPTGFRPTYDDSRWSGAPRWLRKLGVLCLAGSLVTILIASYRHFFDFQPLVAASAPRAASAAAGDTIWVPPAVTAPGGHAEKGLHLTAIRPAVAQNTAGATITVEACLGRGTTGFVWGRYASSNAPQLCGSLRPVSDYDLEPAYMSEPVPIVLAVHATRPGIVKITGVDLNVRDGLQHGSQHVGLTWTIVIRPK